MKELFRLESFKKILFYLFLTGFIIGVLYGVDLFFDKLRFYSIIPFFPVLYIIIKGLNKNIPFLIIDFKLIDFKQ